MADILIFTSTRKTYHGFILSSQCVHQVGNLGFTDTQTHEHTLTFIKFCFQFDAIPLWRDLLSFKWENWNVQKHDSMKFLRVCVCCCIVQMLCYSMHWQWVDWRQPQLSLAVGSDCWLTADCWSPTLTSATPAPHSETIAHRAPRPRTPATRAPRPEKSLGTNGATATWIQALKQCFSMSSKPSLSGNSVLTKMLKLKIENWKLPVSQWCSLLTNNSISDNCW